MLNSLPSLIPTDVSWVGISGSYWAHPGLQVTLSEPGLLTVASEQVATSLVLLFLGWTKVRIQGTFLVVLWGVVHRSGEVRSQGQVSVWPTLSCSRTDDSCPTCLSHLSHFSGLPGEQNLALCLHLKAALAKHLLGRK